MSRTTCHDCTTRIDATTAVLGSPEGERLALCPPCAKAYGWHLPRPSRALADRIDALTARRISAAERDVNLVRQ